LSQIVAVGARDSDVEEKAKLERLMSGRRIADGFSAIYAMPGIDPKSLPDQANVKNTKKSDFIEFLSSSVFAGVAALQIQGPKYGWRQMQPGDVVRNRSHCRDTGIGNRSRPSGQMPSAAWGLL
jgi:hypothetical protein